MLPGSNFTHHGPTKFRQNRNQTIKTAEKIKESNTTSIPLIPSHSKMESKQSKSRENPGKSETLLQRRQWCGLRVLAAWATSSKEPRAGVGESGGACVMTCLVASVRPDSIVHSSGQSLYTHTTTMTVSTRHWSLRTTCSSFCRVALSSH